MDEFIGITRSPDDPDGSRLAEILESQVGLLAARARRAALVYALAFVSAFLWVCVVWPGVTVELRPVAVGVWAACAAGVGAAIADEIRWRRRRTRLLQTAVRDPVTDRPAGTAGSDPDRG